MAESITLTTPITKPNQTGWAIDYMHISVYTSTITIGLIGTNNEQLTVSYPTPAPAAKPSQPTGTTLITALNTANFSSSSLVKAIFNRLITDGYIVGTVTGTPQ